MNTHEYIRTKEVLKVLDKVTDAQERAKKTPIPREEFLRLLKELHTSLEEMFWAGDFDRVESQ